jgi:hypothetical protein
MNVGAAGLGRRAASASSSWLPVNSASRAGPGEFLTEKTIETHLSSVYRKLDIRSRVQLVDALPAAEEALTGATERHDATTR